jgi:NADH-quinone oxidoreductase subunit B
MGIEEKLPSGVLLTTVEKLVNWTRKSSFWPATFGLACCAIEMMATGGARYDLARFGMEVFRASPRQADLMIVAGRVSQKMAPVLRQIYDQMPEPKWVLSMGVCASSGGMFNNYAIVQGVDHVVPVDMYLPGCPPRPEMLMDAILKLHDKVMHEPLGDRRRRAIEAEAAKSGPVAVPAGAMPSSYRFDKVKRAQWEQAAAQGTEEQLRIENWMRERAGDALRLTPRDAGAWTARDTRPAQRGSDPGPTQRGGGVGPAQRDSDADSDQSESARHIAGVGRHRSTS